MADTHKSVLITRHFEHKGRHYAGGPYLLPVDEAKALVTASEGKAVILNEDDVLDGGAQKADETAHKVAVKAAKEQ